MSAVNTEVRVSKRVLWVGSDAYPLQNIARAQVGTLRPEHGTPVRNYLKDLLRWIGLCVAIFIATAILGLHKADAYVIYVFVVLIVISTIRLARALDQERKKRPYYLLLLQTSGDPRTVLASTDQDQIYELVRVIMEAIDNAAIAYQNWISNHYGDIISQYGNENIGKMLA
jgi:hypothetical protein